MILTHLTGRTLVLPDHLAGDIYMMRQPVSLWDFYDFEHLRQWIPAISMDQYLNNRCWYQSCHLIPALRWLLACARQSALRVLPKCRPCSIFGTPTLHLLVRASAFDFRSVNFLHSGGGFV